MITREDIPQGPHPLASPVYQVGFFEETPAGIRWRVLDFSHYRWRAERKLRRFKEKPGARVLTAREAYRAELRSFKEVLRSERQAARAAQKKKF